MDIRRITTIIKVNNTLHFDSKNTKQTNNKNKTFKKKSLTHLQKSRTKNPNKNYYKSEQAKQIKNAIT